MEKAMAPHSSTLSWKIPWTKEPGRLQSMGSLGVGHDWATSLSRIGEGNGTPLQYSFLENPRDGGAWWAAIYGVTQSQTRLKRRSSSSQCIIHLCLYFGSCRSSVNISCIFCKKMFFPGSWIIFIIIILNSFSGRLPISTSFSCFSVVLSCPFSWDIAFCFSIVISFV